MCFKMMVNIWERATLVRSSNWDFSPPTKDQFITSLVILYVKVADAQKLLVTLYIISESMLTF